jgi:very-short-patch-repair endonuclease
MQHSFEVIRGKTLRKNMAFCERLFYSEIRYRLLGYKFRRQYQIGKYYVDFACVEKKLAVELDGEQHGRAKDLEYDSIRTDFIKKNGWTIIRIPNSDVRRHLEETVYLLKMVLDGEIEAKEAFVEKHGMPVPLRLSTPPKSC